MDVSEQIGGRLGDLAWKCQLTSRVDFLSLCTCFLDRHSNDTYGQCSAFSISGDSTFHVSTPEFTLQISTRVG
jgi:hypothetical protein